MLLDLWQEGAGIDGWIQPDTSAWHFVPVNGAVNEGSKYFYLSSRDWVLIRTFYCIMESDFGHFSGRMDIETYATGTIVGRAFFYAVKTDSF